MEVEEVGVSPPPSGSGTPAPFSGVSIGVQVDLPIERNVAGAAEESLSTQIRALADALASLAGRFSSLKDRVAELSLASTGDPRGSTVVFTGEASSVSVAPARTERRKGKQREKASAAPPALDSKAHPPPQDGGCFFDSRRRGPKESGVGHDEGQIVHQSRGPRNRHRHERCG
ncbi:phosphatidylinositol 4-phosphate 5-kinase-like protein 1 isoform x3 protein [Lasius niger]|uniref:Phosphatidylinositol 4-phosphate 5-kinase-like protein 1 isoform x3 protein n=1 Tax=Lasius niger TaxID=67767 RepID=A0A0J7JVM7_LASNI|nr:phosphatidylinositol 4-phosphate 5-kinase-like protein 1 isoform x3 protein [Lasius niger]